MTSKELIECTNIEQVVSLQLSPNAVKVLEVRYLRKDETGDIIETPQEMFMRVAETIASVEDEEIRERAKIAYYNMMVKFDFLPNSPCLMNAGTKNPQLSACFTVRIDDDMHSIFQALHDSAMIFKSGGGVGLNFSNLRPVNDIVDSTSGISSGPISFMRVFDVMTEVVKQGSKRRGALMGLLNVSHPNIMEFINCKRETDKLNNFNISVAVTDKFMEAVKNNEEWGLVNPRNNGFVKGVPATDIFNAIVDNAWATGEPGIVFMDEINRHNPTSWLGRMEAVNPCSEANLYYYESCVLGSLNILNMLYVDGVGSKHEIDWHKLENTTKLAVRFLDNIIDANQYVLPQIEEATKRTRKIGLGIMGFADALIRMGIKYDSDEGIETAGDIMKFINAIAEEESRNLKTERGRYLSFAPLLTWNREELRNASRTCIAPTGSISLIANVSSGIEPIFAKEYNKNVLNGNELPIKHEGDDDVLRTAHDILPEWHVKMQAEFQKYTNQGISKTINMSSSATKDDVRNAILLAYKLGCKSMTVYRDGSRGKQVLTVKPSKTAQSPNVDMDSHITIDTLKLEADRITTSPMLWNDKMGTTTILDGIHPRKRSVITTGETHKVNTGCGNLYITINKDEQGLCETFCFMGRGGGCTASQSEAISRLVSICLRSGIDINEIIRQLKGIRCPQPSWDNGDQILSCADAIAKVLSNYVNDKIENKKSVKESVKETNLKTNLESKTELVREMCGVCPDCGNVLFREEGCVICKQCGYTRC